MTVLIEIVRAANGTALKVKKGVHQKKERKNKKEENQSLRNRIGR